MNASEIMARYTELDAMEDRNDELEFEINDIAHHVVAIEEYGEDVFDAATQVFGEGFEAENLQNGAYQGIFCNIGEFIEEQLLDNLLGDAGDNIPHHWLDFDAIWHDLESGGEYVSVEAARGIYIFTNS